MKRKPIFLVPLALSLFLIGLLLADGTMASGPTLRITIAPRTGPPGTVISVTGEGAQTDKPVKVAFVTSGEGGITQAEIEVAPQADGTFTATIAVPDEAGGGTYAVRAEQTNPGTGNLIHYWWRSFTVTGAAAATPAAPAPVEPTSTSVAAATPEAPAPVEPTSTSVAAATPEAPAPVVPTISETDTGTATEAATPAGMPTTGDRSSESNNTTVLVIAILAMLGVLAAFGVGLRQARKT